MPIYYCNLLSRQIFFKLECAHRSLKNHVKNELEQSLQVCKIGPNIYLKDLIRLLCSTKIRNVKTPSSVPGKKQFLDKCFLFIQMNMLR